MTILKDLRVTVIQNSVYWQDCDANLDHFERLIDAIDRPTHLIVLPEMFTTGFSLAVENLATDMYGRPVQWLKEMARRKQADIAGSIMVVDNGRYYNRLIWAKPSGSLFTYDKRHLFRMTDEDKVFFAGHRRETVALFGWNIRLFICYDLRFPIWTRNLNNQYDLAIFVANWPAARSGHWKTLLHARAIENQAYVIGVNRVGSDGNGLSYSGDSMIIDFQGDVIFHKSHDSCTFTTTLPYAPLKAYRHAFPAWKDADLEMV